jgi:hypothetical protein
MMDLLGVVYTVIWVSTIRGEVHYIPYFPFDLNGQEGIDGWFRRMEKDGFKITKLV